jgi:hypothetical protein
MVDILNIKPRENPGVTAEAPESSLRVLALCGDYPELIFALRERVKERRLVLSELDVVTGLAERYSTKALSPNPATSSRRLGLLSLGPVLQASG